jgi:MFS transporter, PPP family, 3-phenylpropionic acid transporter
MNSQRWLSLNFFTFFFTWGVFLPYWTGWLINAKHLSVPEAGFIMSAGMIVRAMSTLFIYPISTKLYSMSKVMQMFGILSLVAMLFYLPFDSYVTLLIVTILLSAIYPNILPAMESSASILITTDKIHYGKARSYGSLGYTVALVVVGAVTQSFGINSVLWVMMVGLAIIIISQSLQVPEALKIKPEKMDASEQQYSYKDLLKEKGFIIILFISILLQGAHAAYYNFGYVFLDDLNVAGFSIGLILNVAVIIEIIIFANADRFFSKMNVSTMYLIAGTGSTLRWLMILIFPSVAVFIVSQLLHAVSFGIAHYAFIQYISNKLRPGLIPRAQAVYAAFGMSLSVAVLTLLGGYLYDIEPQFAFGGMLICTIPAIILTVLTMKKYKY